MERVVLGWLKRHPSSGSGAPGIKPAISTQKFREYEHHLDNGVRHRCQGRYNDALVSLNEAVRLNPNSAPALIHRAHIYGNMGDFDLAIQNFDAAIKINSTVADYYFFIAKEYTNSRRFTQAVVDLERAVSLNPHDNENWEALGCAHLECNNYQNAITMFDRALLSDEYNEFTLGKKGICLFHLGHFDRALGVLGESIRIYPGIEEVFCFRGMCNVELKNYQGALYDFDCALLINNSSYVAMWRRAKLHGLMENFSLAKADFNEIVSNSPHAYEVNLARNEIASITQIENGRLKKDIKSPYIKKNESEDIQKLLFERDRWKRQAQMAQSRIDELEAALTRASIRKEDKRFSELRRFLAREFHPDNAVADGIEKIVRTEIFKKMWPKIEEIEKAG